MSEPGKSPRQFSNAFKETWSCGWRPFRGSRREMFHQTHDGQSAAIGNRSHRSGHLKAVRHHKHGSKRSNPPFLCGNLAPRLIRQLRANGCNCNAGLA
jgi:hypothetical protein